MFMANISDMFLNTARLAPKIKFNLQASNQLGY